MVFAWGLGSRSSLCLLVALGLCCSHEGRRWGFVLHMSACQVFYFSNVDLILARQQ